MKDRIFKQGDEVLVVEVDLGTGRIGLVVGFVTGVLPPVSRDVACEVVVKAENGMFNWRITGKEQLTDKSFEASDHHLLSLEDVERLTRGGNGVIWFQGIYGEQRARQIVELLIEQFSDEDA